MRLAALTFSAVLLSGCSWYGSGGGYGDSYGYNGAYGGGCMPAQGGYAVAGGCGGAGGAYGAGAGGYGTGMGGAGGYGGGYGGAGGYGAGYGGAGYGSTGYAGTGYGSTGYAGTGYGGAGYGADAAGLRGSYGVGQYGTVGTDAAYGVTTLSANAPYGSAVGGTYGGGTYGGGTVVSGTTTTVQGAPIYVPQPYPAYYAAGGGYNYGGGFAAAALPIGIELFAGTFLNTSGEVSPDKKPHANDPDYKNATGEIAFDAADYQDAFDSSVQYGGAVTYDLDRNTTLIGQAVYSKSDGKEVEMGTFRPGAYDTVGNFSASGVPETIVGSFTDLEEYSIQGGVRQYFGDNLGFRPYVTAMAGFSHNNDVTLTQSTNTSVQPFDMTYVTKGWNPVATGLVGAEVALGSRAGIGIETGVKWTDKLETIWDSESRVAIPVNLRGRFSF